MRENVETLGVKTWGAAPPVNSGGVRPKILWTYWDKDDLPDFIRACVASWHANAPDYDIRVLTRRTVEAYTGPIGFWHRNRAPQVLADWIRLKLIRDHGGIWLDASFLLLRPIEEAFPSEALQGATPFFYYNARWTFDPAFPMVENWLISAGPNDPLIRRWYRDYNLACMSRKTYLALARRFYDDDALFQGYGAQKYFTCFAAFQWVIRRNPGLAFHYMDSELGPFRLPAREGYDDERIAEALVGGADLSDITSIKLTSGWRIATIAKIAQADLAEGSVLRPYL